jgi:hypothetical protein
MIRFPVYPHQFLHRVRIFSLSLALVQLFHLLIFTDASWDVYLTWFWVNSVIYFSVLILSMAANNGKSFVNLPWRFLFAVLAISFVFKFSSRIEYITSTLSYGLNTSRTDPNVGAGGLASYINIFFYPAAILLSFTVIPNRAYIISLVMILLICFTDLLFIGTRNAPVFVLLFIFMTTPFNYSIKNWLKGFVILIGFISIFSYSTTNRGIDAEQFDWQVVFELTGSAQVLHLNKDVASALEQHAPILFPAVFLMHYVTHSIAELENMMKTRDFLALGGGYYITDQFCAVGFCSRDDSLQQIENVNPRSHVYQTIFSTLFYDFGVLLTGVLWVLFLLLLYIRQHIMRNKVGIGLAFFSVILMVGSIENYLFNGLNFVQILMIFLLLACIWFYQNVIRKHLLQNKRTLNIKS